jgi:hypothetical protein
MRVYLPSTLPALAALVREQRLAPPVCGFAVTPALRESYASGEQEELEYAAMMHAARASLRLLAENPQAPPRRVVLAAEVDQVRAVTWNGDPAQVQCDEPVLLADVVSAHVDDLAAEPDIRAAVAALPAADAGDDDAIFIVDGAEGQELMWFAAQELPFLAG